MHMDLAYALLTFCMGLGLLIAGARILVRGAISTARLFGLSEWVIGVVVVGIGTSIPEFSVNVAAALNNTPIGIGTIIGSNTFNALVIVGLMALSGGLYFKPLWLKIDVLLNLAILVLVTVLLAFPVLGDPTFVGVSRFEAVFLFVLFIGWLVFMLKRDMKDTEETADKVMLGAVASFVYVSLGLLGVFFGGQWVVDSAEVLARLFGVSETLIGLTLVAAGTSFPELAVSLTALYQKKTTLAVGNIIGSNIFDFLGILGITGLFASIPIDYGFRFDTIAAFLSLVLLAIFARFFSTYKITRIEGLLLIAVYIFYLFGVLVRG